MTEQSAKVGRTWLSVAEVAALANVSRQSVHQWIGQGRVKPRLTEDGYRICSNDLEHFLKVRHAASTVGIKVETLQQWADAAETVT